MGFFLWYVTELRGDMPPASLKVARWLWGGLTEFVRTKVQLAIPLRKESSCGQASRRFSGLSSLIQRYCFSRTWANNRAVNANGIECCYNIVLLFCGIIVLLYYCNTLLCFCCFDVLSHWCFVLLLFCGITIKWYCSIVVLSFWSIAIL